MNKVIKTLMIRDGLSKEDAEAQFKDGMEVVRDFIHDGRFSEAEDAFMGCFGLEPDFLLDVLL